MQMVLSVRNSAARMRPPRQQQLMLLPLLLGTLLGGAAPSLSMPQGGEGFSSTDSSATLHSSVQHGLSPGKLGGGATCSRQGDCNVTEYCDNTRSCYTCSYINPARCDALNDGTCCSPEFRLQCPNNPKECAEPLQQRGCTSHGDCECGSICMPDPAHQRPQQPPTPGVAGPTRAHASVDEYNRQCAYVVVACHTIWCCKS